MKITNIRFILLSVFVTLCMAQAPVSAMQQVPEQASLLQRFGNSFRSGFSWFANQMPEPAQTLPWRNPRLAVVGALTSPVVAAGLYLFGSRIERCIRQHAGPGLFAQLPQGAQEQLIARYQRAQAYMNSPEVAQTIAEARFNMQTDWHRFLQRPNVAPLAQNIAEKWNRFRNWYGTEQDNPWRNKRLLAALGISLCVVNGFGVLPAAAITGMTYLAGSRLERLALHHSA